MSRSTVSRSLAFLRGFGWWCEVVERWDSFAKIRRDLLGFADVLALRPGEPPLLVQVTSGSNVSARLRKIQNSTTARLWLETGGQIEVHGWSKRKVKRGGKLLHWEVRVVRVDLAWLDAQEEEVAA